ncbi:MAG: YafY family protein [Candidatus Nanopelagicales bacterium]
MATSERTLRLLSLLQTHRHWTGEELAARLEVSVRTVRRDVDRLRELGYPVDAAPGVDGGYQLAPGAVLPPLILDDEEAVALAVALELASQAAVAGIADSAVRALGKLGQVMPRRLAAQVDAVRSATVSVPLPASSGPIATDVLVRLAQLCRDHERATFAYVARDGEPSQREVEPMSLARYGQRWYLVAYDLHRHDWRTFRLDRLSDPVGTGAPFRPRDLPATDVPTFLQQRLGGVVPTYAIEVEVSAPADVVVARIGRWSSVEPLDDDRCVVRMDADVLDWPALAMGMVGVPFRVIGPPEFAEHVRDWATRFTAAT